ncbi:MAG: hypothetical protein IPH78_14890 [Bacteroidetes bacterium]|nr:hypothetical protein [Bacteroidota bacterium]
MEKAGLKMAGLFSEPLASSTAVLLPDELEAGVVLVDEIISIPGIGGRDRKEISMRTLAHIVNARMEEIFAQVYFEIKSSGFANSLNAGIVITGGGSQLKHLKQLVEYTTGGLSARIGFPTAYLSRDNKEEMKHPMFSTGLGLVLEGYKAYDDMKEEQRKDFYPELFAVAELSKP